MGDSLELHPITVLLSLIFWGSMWGIPGMLLAAPMTVSARPNSSSSRRRAPALRSALADAGWQRGVGYARARRRRARSCSRRWTSCGRSPACSPATWRSSWARTSGSCSRAASPRTSPAA
eukprot:scaffold4361_cov341-Prasinococcus_capsulatus_cf.AAC.1